MNGRQDVVRRNELASSSQTGARAPDVGHLARCYGQELRNLARRLTRDPDDAADLLQDSLERALRSAGKVDPKALPAWIVTVMRNLFTDRCRQRRAQLLGLRGLTVGLQGLTVGLQGLTGQPRVATTGFDTSEEDGAPCSSSMVSRDRMAEAVAQLEPLFREVFELHARGLSLAQIAETVGIPAATAGTRLFRARRKLRAILGPPSSPEARVG
jgi:RNA polymerase sigma-70 factor (ECF subfamily)